MPSPPSAGFQLQFLRDLQRILQEGSFTATYKFALVHALADLSVESGDDSGAPLPIHLRDLGERLVVLYWRQVTPWPGASATEALTQHTGGTAAVLRRVRETQAQYDDRLHRVRTRDGEWTDLVKDVSQVVRKYPLKLLQRVGTEEHEFLYANEVHGRGAEAHIILKEGIAYCFRAFYPLILDLVQGAWARFVRKQNPNLLGEKAELREFLFGAERSTLLSARKPLLEFQDGSCFYCRRRIRENPEVDHFIPWSRYPTDLGHNFVVAHQACNSRKSDHLAADKHLERWLARNQNHALELGQRFETAGIPHHHMNSTRIAHWAYQRVEERKGLVWKHGRELVPLPEGWRRLFHSSPPDSQPQREFWRN